MSNFVRYTCNKKNEPTMREDCKKCPQYNPCGKEGKWCFVGALVEEVENTFDLRDYAPDTLISLVYKDIEEQIKNTTLKRRGLF